MIVRILEEENEEQQRREEEQRRRRHQTKWMPSRQIIEKFEVRTRLERGEPLHGERNDITRRTRKRGRRV